MVLEVRYFASLPDRTGTRAESVDVEPSTTIADLWDLLQTRHPGLRDVTVRPMAACDLEYAPWDRRLDGVREVAFLPPVSGG